MRGHQSLARRRPELPCQNHGASAAVLFAARAEIGPAGAWHRAPQQVAADFDGGGREHLILEIPCGSSNLFNLGGDQVQDNFFGLTHILASGFSHAMPSTEPFALERATISSKLSRRAFWFGPDSQIARWRILHHRRNEGGLRLTHAILARDCRRYRRGVVLIGAPHDQHVGVKGRTTSPSKWNLALIAAPSFNPVVSSFKPHIGRPSFL